MFRLRRKINLIARGSCELCYWRFFKVDLGINVVVVFDIFELINLKRLLLINEFGSVVMELIGLN